MVQFSIRYGSFKEPDPEHQSLSEAVLLQLKLGFVSSITIEVPVKSQY